MKTVIIIPFYNEVERINLEKFHQIFNGFPQYNFLLVDDGSLDKTIDLLENFKSQFSTVEVLKLDKNVGKAEAIRSAVLSISNANFISYFDADLEFSNKSIVLSKLPSSTNKKIYCGNPLKI